MGDTQGPSKIRRLLALPGSVFLVLLLCAYLVINQFRPSAWQCATIGVFVLAAMLAVLAIVLRRALRPVADLAANCESLQAHYERLTAILRESETRFRRIFDTMSEGLLLVDQDGLIVASNPRLSATHGWAPRQLVGHAAFRLLLSHNTELAQALRAPPADRPVTLLGYTCDSKGRQRETEITAVRLPYQDQPHTLVLLRDLSAMRRLQHQLAEAQRRASLGHLAGGIAHDFNNLLTPILGYSELLLASSGLDADARADLQAIQRAGERARILAQRLLAYSSRHVPVLLELDLGQILCGCEPLLRSTLPEDIELRLCLPDESLPVVADPGLVEQALMNLVINAKEAMPEGGILDIHLSRQGNNCCLLMRDNGPGIPQSTFDRIVASSATTKGAEDGGNTGLAIAQNIVDQHKGSMTFRNHPEGGCEVRIILPCSAESASLEPSAITAERPHGRGETIVLVEDDAMVRELLDTLLTKHGYHVRAYAGGADCRAGLNQRPAPADLLLTDIVMPGLSGPQLRDRLLAEGLALPTLFMSGHAGDSLVHRGLVPGLVDGVWTDFLQKPMTPEVLLNKLRQMLDAVEQSMEQGMFRDKKDHGLEGKA